MNLFVRLLVSLFISLTFALPAFASVNVDGMNLVSKRRVGRTTFEYTYQVTVTNDTAVDIDDVTAYLSTTGTGTTIVDDTAAFGMIGIGQTVVGTDTIKIRQNRRYPLDLDALTWEVGFDALITISGIVTDEPIGNAVVVGTVTRIESGRPVVESGRPVVEAFSVPADPNGEYTLNLVGVSDADFVDLTANGVDEQADVQLSSTVGSVGTILEDATAGSILVGSDDLSALRVTHVTTALKVLAVRENGGEPFTNDEDLAAAQANVDNEDLIVAAAIIKVVVDNAGIGLPAGVQNTEELLENEQVFEEFLEQIQEENPEELQAAIEETIEELALGYDAAEIPGEMYLSLVRVNPLSSGAQFYEFIAGGTGTNVDLSGESDIDWSINSDGDLFVERNNPLETESFPTREDPPGSGNFVQVRALSSTIEHTIRRLVNGITSDQVLLSTTTQTTFPDNPAIPTEIVVQPFDPASAYLSYRDDGIAPYLDSEISGNQIAFQYFHQDNDTESTIVSENGSDILTFNADGSGITARREFGFSWLIDTLGRLVITFDNGDTNTYARYSAGIPDPSVLVGRYGSSAGARDALSITPTGGLVFSSANLDNEKFRSAFQIVDPDPEGNFGVPRFDFTYIDDGTGCRDSGFLRPFTWVTNAEGYVVNDVFLQVLGGTLFRVRSWQVLTTEPGTLGERFWVIENLNFLLGGGVRTDPTEVPGRINYYENIKNVTGNTPPTANADIANTAPLTPVQIDVLANDVDAEGDDIIITGWTQGTLGGTVTGVTSPSGASFIALLYTPPAGIAQDTFVYSIADGSCSASVNGNVTIDISVP